MESLLVSIGVVTRAATARAALDENNAGVAKVVDTIRAAGVRDPDIGTSGFNVSPVYETLPEGAPADRPARIVGYEVSNEVRVTIRDIAASGAILDQVVTAGANQVNAIVFDVSDRTKPSDSALAAAIGDARRKAELMAEAAGVKLVRILDISASGSVPVFARAEMSFAAKGVPVMPGEKEITANATVSWEIAPK